MRALSIQLTDDLPVRDQLLAVAWIDTFLAKGDPSTTVDGYERWVDVVKELYAENLLERYDKGADIWLLSDDGVDYCIENAIDVRAALLFDSFSDTGA